MQPAHVPECVLRAGPLLQRHMLLPAGLLGRSLRQEVLPSRLQRPGVVRQRRVRVPTWAASTRLRDGFVSTWVLTERLLPEWHGKHEPSPADRVCSLSHTIRLASSSPNPPKESVLTPAAFVRSSWQCFCRPGFEGADCSIGACPGAGPNGCNARGHCVQGACYCEPGWRGRACEIARCPNGCSSHGVCDRGKCRCHSGYQGADCSHNINRGICPNKCSTHGVCTDGVCACDVGYRGIDCSAAPGQCIGNCSGRGQCVSGTCHCREGYEGDHCQVRILAYMCPNDCSDVGVCQKGTCFCPPGFKGEDCSIRTCPNDCSKHGVCMNGQCHCFPGWGGEACNLVECPGTGAPGTALAGVSCSGHGSCTNGTCSCHPGYFGEDCSQLACPDRCNGHGICNGGACVCYAGWMGDACNLQACPNDCHGRGYCVGGKCQCEAPWTGDDCSVQPCPDNCNNRGVCRNDRCYCPAGYTGDACQTRVLAAKWARTSKYLHENTALQPSDAMVGRGDIHLGDGFAERAEMVEESRRAAARGPAKSASFVQLGLGLSGRRSTRREGMRDEPPPSPMPRRHEVEV